MPACPNCGASTWLVPAAVEVVVETDGDRIVHVQVADEHVMQGEGDARCGGCDQLLLDWASRHDGADEHEADRLWEAHHDERRPAWDQLHAALAGLALSHPSTWRWNRRGTR